MARVLLCDEGDFDVETGTCAAPYFGEPPSAIPLLTFEEAAYLGSGFAVMLVCAGIWRVLIKSPNR